MGPSPSDIRTVLMLRRTAIERQRVCAKFMAEEGFSACHCSMSSAAGVEDTSENTLLTEQWHTAVPIAINPALAP